MKIRSIDATTVYRRDLTDIAPDLLTAADREAVADAGPRRRLEITNARTMVRGILGRDAELGHDEWGAPVITGIDEPPFVSITHSRTEIAIAVNPVVRIGIDLEVWRSQLIKVASHFLSPAEMEICRSAHSLLRAWTIKEALYKARRCGSLPYTTGYTIPLSPGGHAAVDGRPYRIDMLVDTPSTCLVLATPVDL